jgi:hypothetical protein
MLADRSAISIANSETGHKWGQFSVSFPGGRRRTERPAADPRTPDRMDTGHLTEWTPRTRPSGHRGRGADTRSDAAPRAAAQPGGQRTTRAAGGCPSSEVRHRRRPASAPGCGAATVQVSTIGPCGTVRCPLWTPGVSARTLRTWTAGHCSPVGGRGRGRRAGPEPVLGDDHHDQGDEEHKPVTAPTSASVCLVERDAGLFPPLASRSVRSGSLSCVKAQLMLDGLAAPDA